MLDDRYFIGLCKAFICDKLEWEPDQITQRDFEYLSNEIFKLTQTDLSTTTLRRIWSNQYKKVPQVNTLNAIAQFLEYENWNDFKIRNNESHPEDPQEKRSLSEHKLILIAPTILILILGAITVLTSSSKINTNKNWSVTFDTDNNTYYGVPATVGFDYDISSVEEDVYIELSWNPYEQVLLDKAKQFYTGVYYYPDYHYSKLLINGQPIVFQPVHVITDDWHGLLMKSAFEKRPIYLDQEEFFEEDRMEVSKSVLNKYQIGKQDTLFSELVYSNPLLDTTSIENLILETRLKSIDYGASEPCRTVLLYLKAENGFAMIPITEAGCYGETSLGFSNTWLQGKFNNLSKLEIDLDNWQTIRVESNERKVKIQVGGNEELELEYDQALGKLKAVKFLFTGLGAVDDLKIWNMAGVPLFTDDLIREFLAKSN